MPPLPQAIHLCLETVNGVTVGTAYVGFLHVPVCANVGPIGSIPSLLPGNDPLHIGCRLPLLVSPFVGAREWGVKPITLRFHHRFASLAGNARSRARAPCDPTGHGQREPHRRLDSETRQPAFPHRDTRDGERDSGLAQGRLRNRAFLGKCVHDSSVFCSPRSTLPTSSASSGRHT